MQKSLVRPPFFAASFASRELSDEAGDVSRAPAPTCARGVSCGRAVSGGIPPTAPATLSRGRQRCRQLPTPAALAPPAPSRSLLCFLLLLQRRAERGVLHLAAREIAVGLRACRVLAQAVTSRQPLVGPLAPIGARAAAGCFPRPAAAAGFAGAFPRPRPRPAAGGGEFLSSSEPESTSEPEPSSSRRSEQYSSSANSSSDSSALPGWSPESPPSPSAGSVDPPAPAVATCALVSSLISGRAGGQVRQGRPARARIACHHRGRKGSCKGSMEGSWAPAAPSWGASPTFSRTTTRQFLRFDLKLDRKRRRQVRGVTPCPGNACTRPDCEGFH